jgi:hypothetical protein
MNIQSIKSERELEHNLHETGLSLSASKYIVKLCKPELLKKNEKHLAEKTKTEIEKMCNDNSMTNDENNIIFNNEYLKEKTKTGLERLLKANGKTRREARQIVYEHFHSTKYLRTALDIKNEIESLIESIRIKIYGKEYNEELLNNLLNELKIKFNNIFDINTIINNAEDKKKEIEEIKINFEKKYNNKIEFIKKEIESKTYNKCQYNNLNNKKVLLQRHYDNLKESYDRLLQEKNLLNLSINVENINLKQKIVDYEIEINKLNKEKNYYKCLIEKNNKIIEGVGYVYLLKTDIDIGYKIGSTKNINERKVFQTNVPFKHEFIKSWYCINYKLVEKKLHKIYEHKRHNGSEWFNLDNKDIMNIDIFFNENNLIIDENIEI